ncbi:MAG TPA: glycogen phosphorylase, partial [Ruminococcaceae bacterium]|nr:glycogen phosphorylase [Oscillospiraceae bacterium]
KRLHEYKRQLLHCLGILALAFQIEQGKITEFAPTTFLFAAKAAPGYARAKAIIKLIHAVGDYVARSPKAAPLLQVLFVPDYSVTAAERIIPA